MCVQKCDYTTKWLVEMRQLDKFCPIYSDGTGIDYWIVNLITKYLNKIIKRKRRKSHEFSKISQSSVQRKQRFS